MNSDILSSGSSDLKIFYHIKCFERGRGRLTQLADTKLAEWLARKSRSKTHF